MSNVLIGYQNAIKTSTIAGTPAHAPGLDASNWQTNESGAPSQGYQSPAGVTSINIYFDAGTQAQLWGGVVVARSNLTANALYRIVIYLDAAQTVLVLALGNAAGLPVGPMKTVGGLSVIPFPAQVAGQRLQLSISDTGNPDGFLNIPLLYAGPLFQPIGNVSWATTTGRDARVDEIVTRSGIEFPQYRWQRRRVSADFQSIRVSEAATWAALDQYSRTGGNVLFVPDKTAATMNGDSIYGRCNAKADFGYPYQSADRKSWKADFTERL